MKAVYVAFVMLLTTGCLYDPAVGTAPCEARCDGCCLGDPRNPNTVCVPEAGTDDSACGSKGRECEQCGAIVDHVRGGVLYTQCVESAEYREMMCAVVQR